MEPTHITAYLSIQESKLEVCGDPSPDVRDALAGLEPRYDRFLDGDDEIG